MGIIIDHMSNGAAPVVSKSGPGTALASYNKSKDLLQTHSTPEELVQSMAQSKKLYSVISRMLILGTVAMLWVVYHTKGICETWNCHLRRTNHHDMHGYQRSKVGWNQELGDQAHSFPQVCSGIFSSNE